MKRAFVGMTVALMLAPIWTAMAQKVVAANVEADQRQGAEELLARPVTLQLTRVSLKTAIDAAAARANTFVQYREPLLLAYRDLVDINVQRSSLRVVLEQILRNTSLRIVIPEGTSEIVISESGRMSHVTNDGIIIGKIVHATTKQPVAKASVTVEGGPSVVSGEDGTFRISVVPGEHTVHARAVGFARVSRRLTVSAEETVTLDMELVQNASVLNEVVVTGTVVATERKAIATPITVITAEEIERRGITRIEEFFRGEVPGVIALDKGTERYYAPVVGSTEMAIGTMVSTDVYTRGPSGGGLVGRPNPLLTFVDGVEIVDPSYLGTIDPQSIERIEIVAGPQAATVYGSGAMGGVMQIFTKKGTNQARPEFRLTMRYGMLSTNMSSGRTPSHNNGLAMTGQTGAGLSYSVNLSHNYTGQWQPGLFNRSLGSQLGVSNRMGELTINGSASFSRNRNGTYTNYSPLQSAKILSGEYWVGPSEAKLMSERIATAVGQTLSLSADYRTLSWWQQSVSVGRNQTDFSVNPELPVFRIPSDSLYHVVGYRSSRLSAGYNTTMISSLRGSISSSLTVGVNMTSSNRLQTRGCLERTSATSLVPCSGSPLASVDVTNPYSDESWGGFGNYRVGFFEQLYVSLGLRGERNAAYGRHRKVDWTPTNGITYTAELGDLTIKLLGSYGRATKAPTPDLREERSGSSSQYSPSVYVYQLANEYLRPEYSRGPQGGIELYYGSRVSVTVNRYQQRVTDLIASVFADTLYVHNIVSGDTAYPLVQRQYQNVRDVKSQGWEGTGMMNVGPVTVKGTWSWMDVRRSPPNASVGTVFGHVPTHSANVSVGYALGGTNVSLTTNHIGASIVNGMNESDRLRGFGLVRIKTYWHLRKLVTGVARKPGYSKSDLAATHRLNEWIMATANVQNLMNDYNSETGFLTPTLGRRITLGATVLMR